MAYSMTDVEIHKPLVLGGNIYIYIYTWIPTLSLLQLNSKWTQNLGGKKL